MTHIYHTSLNLPPGCSPSDLPGNGPMDEALEYWLGRHEHELDGLTEAEVDARFAAWWKEVNSRDCE